MTATAPETGYQDFLTAILSDRERFFAEVVDQVALGAKLRYAVVTLFLLGALYGAAAGAYSGAPQAVSAAIKVPLLFIASLAICFPALFVVQVLAGSRLRLLQVLVIVLGALALTAVLLAAFVPITVFFLLTGANYHFLQLLHVAVALVAGFLGMYAMHQGLALVCEKHGVYPRRALTIMKAWAVLFAFVGIQVAWNLRPFIAKRGEPFRVTRDYEGNFYAAVIYSVNQLLVEASQPARHTPDPRGARSPVEDLFGDSATDSGAVPR